MNVIHSQLGLEREVDNEGTHGILEGKEEGFLKGMPEMQRETEEGRGQDLRLTKTKSASHL